MQSRLVSLSGPGKIKGQDLEKQSCWLTCGHSCLACHRVWGILHVRQELNLATA